MGIRHESQRVVMKIRLGMQQEVNMTPISKLTVSIRQFRSALQLGKSICVLCSKNGDLKHKFGDRMAGLRLRDLCIAADLNGKKAQG